MRPHWPTNLWQWVSVAGLLGYAAYNATAGQYDQAIESVLGALAVFGIGSKQARTSAKIDAALDDLQAIRQDPMMPGSPMPLSEVRDRDKLRH